MTEPEIHPEVYSRWGLVVERIAADSELKEAVLMVLGYETVRLEKRPDLRTLPEADYARLCHVDGEEEGLGIALRALTDRKYIEEQRGLILDRTERTDTPDD